MCLRFWQRSKEVTVGHVRGYEFFFLLSFAFHESKSVVFLQVIGITTLYVQKERIYCLLLKRDLHATASASPMTWAKSLDERVARS